MSDEVEFFRNSALTFGIRKCEIYDGGYDGGGGDLMGRNMMERDCDGEI